MTDTFTNAGDAAAEVIRRVVTKSEHPLPPDFRKDTTMGEIQTVERIEAPVPVSAQASESAAILAMIERAARDPSVNIERMQQLFDMRERLETRRAKMAFNEAMAAAQAELPQVVRKAENTHTKSFYATLETIGEAIDPIITSHGFSQSFSIDDCPLPGHYRLVCRTAHIGGYEQIDHADLPADIGGSQGKANKTAIQALGSTLSYGRRYLTLLIFNVKTQKIMKDDDGNGALNGASVSEDQADRLRQLALEVRADMPRFLDFFKADDINSIPAAAFEKARLMLEAKRQRMNAGA